MTEPLPSRRALAQARRGTGFYRPDGKWESESDHGSEDRAAERVRWLNGGSEKKAAVVTTPPSSLRDLFASCFMEGCASKDFFLHDGDLAHLAERSYKAADAMVKRSKT